MEPAPGLIAVDLYVLVQILGKFACHSQSSQILAVSPGKIADECDFFADLWYFIMGVMPQSSYTTRIKRPCCTLKILCKGQVPVQSFGSCAILICIL